MVNSKRVCLLKEGESGAGPVIYWMSRDQRAHDNWALLFAQEEALKKDVPLIVLFNLVTGFLNAGLRQYEFMLKGLKQLEGELASHNIPFIVAVGKPEIEIPAFIKKHNASLLIMDFDPLRIKQEWKQKVNVKINIPFYEVDAHNIVPCRYASQKQEYAAYTLRPKINKLLGEFLVEFPGLKIMPRTSLLPHNNDWHYLHSILNLDAHVKEVNWLIPGEEAARKTLTDFLNNKFEKYAELRNNPVLDYQSGLSPYLHFGQISSQRAALEALKISGCEESQKSFLDEIIVRKELADNFCLYNRDYDNYNGLLQWGKDTLTKHLDDKREYVYPLEEFEKARTHEDLWNAAQMEMVQTGKMHGYMRMYWAKKILEWSATPEEAIKTAVYLNDKYSIDGRDPNGYAGIAWAIGGVHDRQWFERDIFGKVRYMNRNGAKSKFDIKAYIKQHPVI